VLGDEDITCCLCDIGCTSEEASRIATADARTRDLMLARVRQRLLERIHGDQERLDCLDYLIFQLRCKGDAAAGSAGGPATRCGCTKTRREDTIMGKRDLSVFETGAPNDAYAQYFVGQSYLKMLSTEQVGVGNVTFEPGCRNNWHVHHATKGGGQILLVTAGCGWYQEWGKSARRLGPGDVVNIPEGVKHWHGATKDSWFQHLAIEVPGEDASNEWLEPVSDEDYAKLG
jgi:quercetin dioxygenase-like cupin family protein